MSCSFKHTAPLLANFAPTLLLWPHASCRHSLTLGFLHLSLLVAEFEQWYALGDQICGQGKFDLVW